MQAKLFEVLDRGTFIPVLAVRVEPRGGDCFDDYGRRTSTSDEAKLYRVEEYLLNRAGFAAPPVPVPLQVILMKLDCHHETASFDPYIWEADTGGARTMGMAHTYIIANWNELTTGDVIDIEFILGETKEPKRSER